MRELVRYGEQFDQIAENVVWYTELESVAYSDLPNGKAIVVTDMVNGFVHNGALASDRVRDLVPGISALVEHAYDNGVQGFLSVQDSHRADSLEFKSFPEHCVRGTREADLIPELSIWSFWKSFRKDTLTAAFTKNSDYNSWAFNSVLMGMAEKRNPGASDFANPCNVNSIIVVGNCTDLCVYQAAMHIKQLYTDMHHDMEVVVPVSLVDTYDAPGHDADFYNVTFLRHMALNGIRVVKDVTW